MVRLSEQVIKKSFEFRNTRWQVPDGLESQLGMYTAAAKAFGPTKKPGDFKTVYYELKKHWVVFRNGGSQSPEWIYRQLCDLDGRLRTQRLSELSDKDWPEVWKAIEAIREVKKTKKPSIMAISKFLHFWNPRLFLICDQAEVEQFVFGHRWLKKELDKFDKVPCLEEIDTGNQDNLLEYCRKLVFVRKFLQANRSIPDEFANYIESKVKNDAIIPKDINAYEAVAAEWCLVGLAEMPPFDIELG